MYYFYCYCFLNRKRKSVWRGNGEKRGRLDCQHSSLALFHASALHPSFSNSGSRKRSSSRGKWVDRGGHLPALPFLLASWMGQFCLQELQKRQYSAGSLAEKQRMHSDTSVLQPTGKKKTMLSRLIQSLQGLGSDPRLI